MFEENLIWGNIVIGIKKQFRTVIGPIDQPSVGVIPRLRELVCMFEENSCKPFGSSKESAVMLCNRRSRGMRCMT